MKLLEKTLANIVENRKQSSHPALMTHVVLGYPSLERSIEIVKTMEQAGAKIVEVQIPFTDPIADGPTIMHANQTALNNGVTPPQCLKAIEEITNSVNIPVLIMSYFNIPFSFKGGVKEFCSAAGNVGAQGLIIPDLPPEEDKREHLSEHAKNSSLQLIPIVSPLSTNERLKKHKEIIGDSGFIYCVSTTGTTGARRNLPPNLAAYTSKVRSYFSQPLALGFGISTAEQVRAVGEFVEIAIVGSATIDVLRKAEPSEQLDKLHKFIHGLTNSCNHEEAQGHHE